MTVPELSFIEERVVSLLVAGRTKSEVAASLGLDERTVEWHLARAAAKVERATTLLRRASDIVHDRPRRTGC